MLRQPFWVFMGGISYFVYLFHFPAMYTSHALLRNTLPAYGDGRGLAALLVALAGLIGAAVFSRRWIELPFIRLGHRFRYRLP